MILIWYYYNGLYSHKPAGDLQTDFKVLKLQKRSVTCFTEAAKV